MREWDKEQGAVSLRISAGTAKNPKTGKWVQLDLPFGPKPRLILAHLNTEALKTGSPEIDVEESLTGFVKRVQKRAPTGPEIRIYKEQLSRLATATIRMAMSTQNRVFQMNNHIVVSLRSAHQERAPARPVAIKSPVEPRILHESPKLRRAAR